MTTSRGTSMRLFRPEPSRWWIRHAPNTWPAPAGLWTHLAERTLGRSRSGAMAPIDTSSLFDVVYLPPADAENEAAALALAEQLRSASVPVVTQCRPERGGSAGQVLDLLATLVEGGVQALADLVTDCESAVWPLIPGLTGGPESWEPGLDLLAAAGLRVVVPQTLQLGPVERRELAEFTDDDGYQALFHGPPPDERAFVRAAAARGLATRPRRPELGATPRAEFCRRAAAELIVVADLWLKLARPEAAGQNLLRAARWVEESEQDLRALAREGNLGVLPWLDVNSLDIVSDLAADRPSALRRALELEYSGGCSMSLETGHRTATGEGLGLYVHIPFCRTRCRYCDFYRVGENAGKMTLFLNALEREIEGVEPPPGGLRVDSVFFGGGTPSLLTPAQAARVLDRLRRRYEFAVDCEVSLKANPSDLSVERLAEFRAAGVNRLSLGVQSFCDRELKLLGRRHDGGRAADCGRWARAAGFTNVSLDLMLGIPGQTAASFRRTVERALGLQTDHVSVYMLEVHAGSEIDILRRKRPGLFPSEEAQCRRYEWLADRLPQAGLAQYEISNFARAGAECRHNLKYWRRQAFLGFGPSAHSCLGARRWRRPADLVAYLENPLAAEEQETDAAEETIFLGLRLAEGLEVEVLARLLDLAAGDVRARLSQLEPLLLTAGGRVRFSVRGFLVSNSVLTELLGWKREAIA